jgi:HSP20 family protein
MTQVAFTRDSRPSSALERLQNAFESVFENPRGVDLGPSGRGAFPPANVFHDADGLVVQFEVPGVDPANLEIETRDRTLIVSGKRDEAASAGSYHRRERWTGAFSRSLQLPRDADLEKVEAKYKHGVLTVRVPKHESARPRRIEVSSS